MQEEIVINLDGEKLMICIDILRDLLNEMCVESDDPELNTKRLILSQELDELIVKYMKLKK